LLLGEETATGEGEKSWPACGDFWREMGKGGERG